MNDDTTALAVTREPDPEPLIHLIATNPEQMNTAREDLKTFLVAKIESLDQDIIDLNASLKAARDGNFNARALTRLRDQAVENQEFFAKVLAAVEAGYTIVPDFPVDLFAIRVRETTKPIGPVVKSEWMKRPQPHAESCDVLPAGEGHYVSPIPRVVYRREHHQRPVGADQRIEKYTVAVADPVGFRQVVFPLRAARAEVMEATNEAMVRKIFDQIGICPPERKADPLILGQICTSRRSELNKRVNFLIAWHLNLREL